MKIIKGIFSVLLTLILLCAGFVVGFAYRVFFEDRPTSDVFLSGDLAIHFLELGNNSTGDSIFIQCGENDILIDAGSDNTSSSTLISYIDNYVTDNTLEYVIATHGHTDHIGAFYSTQSNGEGIFEHYVVENIIDFPLTNSSASANSVVGRYYSARDEEIANGANHYSALECYNNQNGGQRVIELSQDVELEILYNYYYEHTFSSGENNYSVCVMINQGDNHYLFTGDLEEEGEERLVDYYAENHGGLPHCVLYKAGHHGSYTSSTAKLMEAITPEYICICCCAGTSEYTTNKDRQFPSQDFIDRVAPYTDKIYVTTVVDYYSDSHSECTVKSMNGNIIFRVSNGEITIECSNNDTILKDTEWFKANRTCPAVWQK